MATETESSFTNRDAVPSVTQDARFRAGQKLKQSGRVHLGAIHMFEILADRAEDEFGITSIETAAVYYELGHSIFLNLTCHRENSTDPANEERSKANTLEDALEYMAKSCSILYAHDQNHDNDDNDDPPAITASTKYQYQYQNQYQEWARDQIPRVLIGIGNIQSYQHKHADAIDSYMNAVPYREAASDACRKETHQSSASLKRHRLFAESHVLIAEELLISMAYYSSSPPSDLVHSETGLIIVKADQVTTLAKTYYEQGKEKLQDIVYMMASLEEEGSSELLSSEKQDVCHLATMLMEVGMSLAQLGEEDTGSISHSNSNSNSKSTGPAVKRKRVE